MLLLTGATGLLGHAVVRRLVARGTPVRCLVRDPRRLGPERVRVQLAIGDLADPAELAQRAARRGHGRAPGRRRARPAARDRRGAQRARRLAAAARRRARRRRATSCGSRRSAPRRTTRCGCSAPRRWPRRRWPSRRIPTTTLAHSLIYSPGDRHLLWLERLGYLPAVPLVGPRDRPHAADLGRGRGGLRARGARRPAGRPRPLRAGRPGDAHPARGRAARARRRGPPPARAAAPARRPARRAAGRGDARRPDRARHLGRGAAARGRDAQRDAGPPTPRRSASRPRADVRRLLGRWCAHGCAASICAASWSSVSSLSGLPTICTPVGSPSAPKPTGQRDRGLAGDVEQRRVGREHARSGRGPAAARRRARCTRRSPAAARPAPA